MCVMREFPGRELDQRILHGPRFSPTAIRVRLATRKMCVSTAIVGSPKIVFRTTFAVLRPTREALQCFTRTWDFAAMFVCNQRRCGHHVARLGFPEPDGADVFRGLPRRDSRCREASGPPGTTYGSPRSRSCPWPAPRGSRATSSSNGVWYSSRWSGAGSRRAGARRFVPIRGRSWFASARPRAALLVGEYCGRSAARRATRALRASNRSRSGGRQRQRRQRAREQRDHDDAIHGAGRDTKLAARAQLRDHGMHALAARPRWHPRGRAAGTWCSRCSVPRR